MSSIRTLSYNWGYDPASISCPEGSYSVDVSDPFSPLNEVRMMVSAFHNEGIRIVMDVVFNHVYEYLFAFREDRPELLFPPQRQWPDGQYLLLRG
jgi:pullulanase